METPHLDFIWQNRRVDPAQLALQASKHPHLPMQQIAAQVAALQKIEHKVPSWYRSGIKFPSSLAVEQCSSERTAHFKAGLLQGRSMADLTGGLGIDAWAFAQRFASVTHVEFDNALAKAAKHNFALLQTPNIRCIHEEASVFLKNCPHRFDLAYLDPARRHALKGRVAQLSECTPNILKIKNLIFQCTDQALLKTAPMLDIQAAVAQLGCVSKIWIVAYEGDCREVLYLLNPKSAVLPEKIPVTAVALGREAADDTYFEVDAAAEKNARPVFALPENFLYEPNAAVMKSGALKHFAVHFGLKKLHPNTHLYTSQQRVPQVPGRCFDLVAVCKYERKAVAEWVPNEKANVTTRNFPDTPDQVRKKLGLRDGGDLYLFACNLLEDKKAVLVCRKSPENPAAR